MDPVLGGAASVEARAADRLSLTRRLMLALLVFLSAAQTLRLFQLDTRWLILEGHLSDGALLSMRIAENLAHGGGETFDTQARTNGYQPLWVWLIAPLFAVWRDPMQGALAAWVLSAILFHAALGLGLWVLARELRSDASFAAAGAFLALSPGIKVATLNGLETSLFLALFIATVGYLARRVLSRGGEMPGPWSAVIAGALLAATFLARLDSFFLSLILGAWVLLGRRDLRLNDRVRYLAVVALTEAALVAPYLIRNRTVFGRMEPLSGVVKQWYLARVAPDLASYLASSEWLGPVKLFLGVLAVGGVSARPALLAGLVLLCLLSVAAALWSLRQGSSVARLWFGYSAAHLLYFVLVYRENREHTSYYFVVEVIGVAALLILALARTLEGSTFGARPAWALAALVMALGVAASVGRAASGPREGGLKTTRYDAALWARDNLPADTSTGAFWAGTFSFVSQGRVVDLIGLCNNGRFFERYVARDRVADYVLERGISHIAGDFDFLKVGPDGRVAVETPAKPTWGTMAAYQTLARLAPRLRVVRDFGDGFYLLAVIRDASPGRGHSG